jgi:hypothetical protein
MTERTVGTREDWTAERGDEYRATRHDEYEDT